MNSELLFFAVFGTLIIAMWFVRKLTPPRKSSPNTFWYVYARYPMDHRQFFSVEAKNQEEADVLAHAKHADMFKSGQTTMLEFYRTIADKVPSGYRA